MGHLSSLKHSGYVYIASSDYMSTSPLRDFPVTKKRKEEMTHMELSAQCSRHCTAQDMTLGGLCLNCGGQTHDFGKTWTHPNAHGQVPAQVKPSAV